MKRIIVAAEEDGEKNKRQQSLVALPITVTYWAGRGRCEPIRVLLAASGVDFKCKFLRDAADIESLRDAGKLAYGQVPLVEIGTSNFVQVVPVLTYIARQQGLYPEDSLDAFVVDQTVAACQDARAPLLRYPWTLDKAEVAHNFNIER